VTAVRIDLRVSAPAPDGTWQVAVAWPGAAAPAVHAMAAAGPYPAPQSGALAEAAIAATLGGLRSGDGTATAADVRALGDHLFAALVAPAWGAIEPALAAAGASLVDLALAVEDAPSLAGLPWEMMRQGGAFIAAGVKVNGRRVEAVVTRRVKRAPVAFPALVQPLRYLFAVGTELGDAVRAGAETLGLLRQVGPAVRERIVQRQSLEHLANEASGFDPHVLHVICHGRDGGKSGVELEMWNDDLNEAAFVGAGELVDRVVRQRGTEQRVPTLVILSACSSGQRLDAAASTDLATALVQRGVPIVVGMAAEIRDLACRLFTRRLGHAVVDRVPLLAAAAAGRSAALRSPQLPEDAFDWGLIQLVMGDDIDTALAVSACAPDSDEAKVVAWLAHASLPIDLDPTKRSVPPLCGANEALDAFYRLMAPDEPGKPNPLGALLLHAMPPKAGLKVGKRRAFAEVAAAAIRAGHIPVIVMPTKAGSGYPVDAAAVVKRLDEAFLMARARLKLEKKVGALRGLAAPFGGSDLRQAIEADAAVLLADARAAHDFVARAGGEVIVMLHDVHRYSQGASTALELLATNMGAGFAERVRVVMSWARVADDPTPGRAARDEELDERLREGTTWIAKVDLRPLEGAHASFAYQRVLLHPFRTSPDYAARRWFLDLGGRDRAAVDTALRQLHKGTSKGCAGEFAESLFLDFMEEAIQHAAAVRPADDDDVLRGGGGA
jgi:hypothetical protein